MNVDSASEMPKHFGVRIPRQINEERNLCAMEHVISVAECAAFKMIKMNYAVASFIRKGGSAFFY